MASQKPPRDSVFTKVGELRPGMKNVNVIFVCLDKAPPTKTKDEHTLAHAVVADQTGCIHLSLWDSLGDQLQPGDIIRLTSGYVTLFKNSLTLYAGRYGRLERTGEFCMLFSETPDMSALQWLPDPANAKNWLPLPPGHNVSVPPALLNQYTVAGPFARAAQQQQQQLKDSM